MSLGFLFNVSSPVQFLQSVSAPSPRRQVGGLLRVCSVANGNKVRVLASYKH